MSDSRYMTIYDDLKRDLLAVAKRHGKRALREAVRDAAKGNLIQDEDDQQKTDSDVPPEELDYPDEDVWTLPPAPDDEEGEEEDDGEDDELSEAAEQVASELAEKLERRLRK